MMKPQQTDSEVHYISDLTINHGVTYFGRYYLKSSFKPIGIVTSRVLYNGVWLYNETIKMKFYSTMNKILRYAASSSGELKSIFVPLFYACGYSLSISQIKRSLRII